MAGLEDLREIAAALPGVVIADEERFGLSVVVKGKPKGFVWAWAERVHPKKSKVINNEVVAVAVPGLKAKEVILQSLATSATVLDPHYDGYPAILVRLEFIGRSELEDLVIEGWRTKAPKQLVADYDRANGRVAT